MGLEQVWGLRFLNQVPGNADAAGPEATLRGAKL